MSLSGLLLIAILFITLMILTFSFQFNVCFTCLTTCERVWIYFYIRIWILFLSVLLKVILFIRLLNFIVFYTFIDFCLTVNIKLIYSKLTIGSLIWIKLNNISSHCFVCIVYIWSAIILLHFRLFVICTN